DGTGFQHVMGGVVRLPYPDLFTPWFIWSSRASRSGSGGRAGPESLRGRINAKRFVRTVRALVRVPFQAEIPPFGIERFDQGHLLCAPPDFDLLLSLDSDADVRILLEVDQTIESILAGKPRQGPVLVLVIAALYVVRDADVQGFRTPGLD